MNVAKLRLVPPGHPVFPDRVIAIAPTKPARVVHVGQRAIHVPLISLLLLNYCDINGEMIDTQSEYGQQISAHIGIISHGTKWSVVGAVVPLVGAHDLLLPFAFFKRDDGNNVRDQLTER